jgi:flagellar hook protein FlgE
LAVFNNPEGLHERDPGVFTSTTQSGGYSFQMPGEGSGGSLITKTYEGSSVDGTSVYLNMIEDQNNYVANLKAIETINKMKERLMQI